MEAAGTRHLPQQADHRERVEHYSCIETELRVQGEVYELPNWRPARSARGAARERGRDRTGGLQ